MSLCLRQEASSGIATKSDRIQGKLIGQNIFMRTIIEADDGKTIDVLTMGPIGIIPELKSLIRTFRQKKSLSCPDSFLSKL